MNPNSANTHYFYAMEFLIAQKPLDQALSELHTAMSLDPNGCTFWYTNMYYTLAGTGVDFNTRIGAFSFPSCTPVATGTVSGKVTAAGSGNPIRGATVALGSRTATTAVDGSYSFAGLPSGTYPSIVASFAGFISSTTLNVLVSDGATTTVNFSLTAAQAKLKTGRLAVRAAEEAVQIHGGYGYIEEYPVCRFYRDAKILTIGEGTDEVQQMVIARALGA